MCKLKFQPRLASLEHPANAGDDIRAPCAVGYSWQRPIALGSRGTMPATRKKNQSRARHFLFNTAIGLYGCARVIVVSCKYSAQCNT